MVSAYTIASSSASTTYGNVMTVIKERLQKEFPIGFFKDIYLSSEIAYVNVRRRLGRNTLKEMSKLERPYMAITPQINVPSGDQYLYDIPLTKNIDNMEVGVSNSTLFPFIKNDEDGYDLTYKINRDQIQFEIVITMDTKIQQIDMYKYMVNHFVWERPFVVKTSLEAMIPHEIIKETCLMSNIDIDSKKSNQIPSALEMMNIHSRYPVTYKIRNGTALDEFFLYYNAELLLTYSDLSLDDINRKNFADDYCQIRFNCTAEFNLPGMFALIGKKKKPDTIEVDLVSKERDGYHDLIPLYTIYNFYNRYTSERNGFTYYINTRFQTECKPNTTIDRLDISVLFGDEKKDVISRYASHNIPISTLIDALLLINGEEINDGSWDIDWTKMELTVKDADDTATYCLIIYINNKLFVEEYSDKVETLSKDKPRI